MKNWMCWAMMACLIQGFAQSVTTQFGPVQGQYADGVFKYLGIPYAKPPVGNLRWQPPQSPDPWTTPINAADFAPICPQKSFQQGGGTTGTVEGQEDCLYLNVWTPIVPSNTQLPVMVFIHGGGNQQGSAQEENFGVRMYDGSLLAFRGNVIVVTIQYRLGPLGFLVHPGLDAQSSTQTSGNYAVMDQILALQWVQNNIAAFGGDPQRVMVFGESAGAVNTSNLLLTPLAQGLFQRAGIQSGMPSIATYAQGTTSGQDYVNGFVSSGTDAQKIAYMRSLPAADLVANETAPLSGGVAAATWRPVVDGHVFTQLPQAAIQSGNYNKVPVLIGSNADEMSLAAPQTVTPAMTTALKIQMVPTALLSTANALYPSGSTNDEARASYVGMLTDAQFTANARRTAQCLSRNQTQPVYRYFFTYKHSLAALATYGSYHGMELFYIFNQWENSTWGSGMFFSASDFDMQNAMLRYWVNFAYNGDPNGSGLALWPAYDANTDTYMELNDPCVSTQTGIRTAACNLWDQAASYTTCTSSLDVPSQASPQLAVFPNPTSGLVQWQGDAHGAWTLYGMSGQKISQGTGNQADVSALQAGMYLLQIEQNGQRLWAKVLRR